MCMAKSNGDTYISLETDVGNRMLCSWTACGIDREFCLRLGYDLLVIEEIGAPRLADLMASTTMALTVSRKQRSKWWKWRFPGVIFNRSYGGSTG